MSAALAFQPTLAQEQVARALSLPMSRARFSRHPARDVCVELPEEALDRGETTGQMVGRLLASLYGARDASANMGVQDGAI